MSDTFSLIDNANIAADGPSGTEVPITTASMLAVTLETEGTVTGTSPTLDAWLQHSTDKEEWFDMPANLAMPSSSLAANVSAAVNKRNVNGDNSMEAQGEKHTAIYSHVPAGWIRANWKIGGTAGPTFNGVKMKGAVKG